MVCRSSTEEEEEEEENGSMCSCSGVQREGDAFPKAFERELVTPTNLSTTSGEKLVSWASTRCCELCRMSLSTSID